MSTNIERQGVEIETIPANQEKLVARHGEVVAEAIYIPATPGQGSWWIVTVKPIALRMDELRFCVSPEINRLQLRRLLTTLALGAAQVDESAE
jgi:hypothetical protein